MNGPRLPRELGELLPGELLVSETFLSIQGESSRAGCPCFFIRLTGCPLRCRWCDSQYAFFGGRRRSIDHLVDEASASGCRLVEVTGGEPLIQRSTTSLLSRLCDRGLEVLLETSGAVDIAGVDPRVRRIVDWKAPASGEADHNRPGILDALRARDELKIVLAGRVDYEWARDWLAGAMRSHPALGHQISVHFSPAFGRCKNSDLAKWIIEDRLPVRLNLQIHKYIWDPERRGV